MKRGFLGLIFLFLFFSASAVYAQENTVTFNGTISELTIKTGANKNILNLSEYFSSNNTVSYKYKAGSDGIEGLVIEINSGGKVDIEAINSGGRSVIFIADDDITAVQSNDVKIKITGDAIVKTSFSPNIDNVQIDEGKSQTFAVSGNKSVEWYVDNIKLNHSESIYEFKDDVGLHNVKAIVDGEQKTWNISVLSKVVSPPAPNEVQEVEQQGPICGNNVREAGENCSNCASDVKCSTGTECVSGVCVPIKQKNNLILWLALLALVIVFFVVGIILIRKKNFGAGFFEKIKSVFRKKKKDEVKIEEERAEKIEEFDLNPLVVYFKNNLVKYKKEELVKQALRQGWTQEQIDNALGKIGDGNDNLGNDKKTTEGKQ